VKIHLCEVSFIGCSPPCSSPQLYLAWAGNK